MSVVDLLEAYRGMWGAVPFVALLGGFCAIQRNLLAAEVDIVVPNNRATTVGNSADNFPFGTIGGSLRWQQVYGASQFSAIDHGGGWVDAVSFRVGGGSAGYIAGVSNLQINLSTTGKGPDGLSAVFADNVGVDDKVVFGPGPVALSGIFGFDVRIPLSSPFYYDPTAGNLLMEIRNYSGDFWQGRGGYLNGDDILGDSISQIFGGVNEQSAFLVRTFGLVTDFSVTPVPEPSTLLLLAAGGIPVAAWLRCRARRKGGER